MPLSLEVRSGEVSAVISESPGKGTSLTVPGNGKPFSANGTAPQAGLSDQTQRPVQRHKMANIQLHGEGIAGLLLTSGGYLITVPLRRGIWTGTAISVIHQPGNRLQTSGMPHGDAAPMP